MSLTCHDPVKSSLRKKSAITRAIVLAYPDLCAGRLYTNGAELREITWIQNAPYTEVAQFTRLTWERRLPNDGSGGSVLAKSFRRWVNTRPKKLSSIVYGNLLTSHGLWSPVEPVECHWDDAIKAWASPDKSLDLHMLGELYVKGKTFFASEREVEAVMWMRGVRAALTTISNICTHMKR